MNKQSFLSRIAKKASAAPTGEATPAPGQKMYVEVPASTPPEESGRYGVILEGSDCIDSGVYLSPAKVWMETGENDVKFWLKPYTPPAGAAVTEQARVFTQKEIELLQSEVHEITGNGKVMALFNKLLGVNAGS